MYWLVGLLGIITIAAPYLFNFADNMLALWTSLIFGAILVVVSVLEGFAQDKERWEYWVIGITGIAAILAPFVLGFSAIAMAVWTLVLIGVGTVALAGTKLFAGRTRLGY